VTVKCDCGFASGVGAFARSAEGGRVELCCPACGREEATRWSPDHPFGASWRRERRPGEREPGILQPGVGLRESA
jgi:hypothetical protein